MFEAFKALFGKPDPKPQTTSQSQSEPPPEATPEAAPVSGLQPYVEWRAAHPHEAEQFAAEFPRARHLRCEVHDADLVTTLGYRSRMDSLPSGSFMDAAAHNPFCLDVGERLRFFKTGIPTRLVFCEACEAGMKARLG